MLAKASNIWKNMNGHTFAANSMGVIDFKLNTLNVINKWHGWKEEEGVENAQLRRMITIKS